MKYKVGIISAISLLSIGLLAPQPSLATTTTCSNAFPGATILQTSQPTNIGKQFGGTNASEGVWSSTKFVIHGQTAIKTTRVQFSAGRYATMVWLDPNLVSFSQIPGTTSPIDKFGTGKIPDSLRPCYLAAFTGAYLMKDSQGGAIYNGVQTTPVKDPKTKKVVNTGAMVDGKATLVTYSDGTLDVVAWPNINHSKTLSSARQNLPLIVQNGVSQVPVNEPHNSWGWVWQGTGVHTNDVYRSGIGVRADGTIVWVLGAKLNATGLANLLIRGGAVRAMALDMNKGFANGVFYGPYHTAKVVGIPINPDAPTRVTRFWNTNIRDFVAVFARP